MAWETGEVTWEKGAHLEGERLAEEMLTARESPMPSSHHEMLRGRVRDGWMTEREYELVVKARRASVSERTAGAEPLLGFVAVKEWEVMTSTGRRRVAFIYELAGAAARHGGKYRVGMELMREVARGLTETVAEVHLIVRHTAPQQARARALYGGPRGQRGLGFVKWPRGKTGVVPGHVPGDEEEYWWVARSTFEARVARQPGEAEGVVRFTWSPEGTHERGGREWTQAREVYRAVHEAEGTEEGDVCVCVCVRACVRVCACARVRA